MAQLIKLKRSSVAGKVPTTAQLDAGEIAINTADGKLYFERDDSTVQTIVTTNSDTTGSIHIIGAVTASVVSASYIDLDVLPDGSMPSHRAGRIFFGAEDGTLEVYNEEADVTLQVGQEMWVRAYNGSAGTILNGTPVRISGSQGDRVKIFPALAPDHSTSPSFENHIIGLATHDIEAATEGYITKQGIVRGVDTSAFAAGDILYLQTGSVGLRNTPPPFPYDIVQVGYVARSASPNGFVFVEPKEPVHFSNISGLSGSASNIGDLWVYQSNGSWTPTHTLSGSYTVNGKLTVTGGITGSLLGTAATASYAIESAAARSANATFNYDGYVALFSSPDTSAQVLYKDIASGLRYNPATNRLALTGSLEVTGGITGSLLGTATSASHVPDAIKTVSAGPTSYNGDVIRFTEFDGGIQTHTVVYVASASLAQTAKVATTATNSATASYGAANFTTAGDVYINGNTEIYGYASVESLNLVAPNSDGFSTTMASSSAVPDGSTVTMFTINSAGYEAAFLDYVVFDSARTNKRAGNFRINWDLSANAVTYDETSTKDIGDTTKFIMFAEVVGSVLYMKAENNTGQNMQIVYERKLLYVV